MNILEPTVVIPCRGICGTTVEYTFREWNRLNPTARQVLLKFTCIDCQMAQCVAPPEQLQKEAETADSTFR